MIASLRGKLIEIDSNRVVVEVGGVGFQVYIPAPLKDQLHRGDIVSFFTHLVVRQDALNLYGFDTPQARDFFLILLSVNGVGPRLALSMLSVLTPESMRRAVFNQQAELFSRVPGVGKKTAQKILLYLQDRIKTIEGFEPLERISDLDGELLSALTSLGYSVVEAQAALQSIPKDAPEDVESRLRLALQYFST
jgi:Holliday junction DNA helicase RuvA